MEGEPPPAAASVPFAWADKRVLRKIRQSFDSQNTQASALAVYHALTEVASDKQADEFVTTIPFVAHRAGLSPRTTGERIKDLAGIGALGVQTPKLKAPSTYRLLPFDQDSAVTGNGCRAMRNDSAATGNGCRTFGKPRAPSLRTLEESIEESEVSLPAPAFSEIPSLEEVKEEAERIGLAEWVANDWFLEMETAGWKFTGGRRVQNWRAGLARKRTWWENDGRPMTPPSRNREQTKGAKRPDHSKPF